jgi:membrane protease YdiL (CAAX protease family)
MSVTKKAIVFLVITFAVSWTALVHAWLQGHGGLRDAGVATITAAFGPALAALVCSVAFEKGQRLNALGLRFRRNWWWLWALLIPFGLVGLTLLVTALFSQHRLVGIEDVARQLAVLQHQHYSDAGAYLLQTAGRIGVAIVLYSILFALSEELGWRGYLYHLWRRFGFWRFSFAVGLIWGVWHWPMIYLFGLNYPDHRVVGLFIFPIYTILLAVMYTLVRDRGGSVWPAGVTHGTYNALAILTLTMVDAPQFPWTAAGVSGIVSVAIGALLILLFQRRDAYREA